MPYCFYFLGWLVLLLVLGFFFFLARYLKAFEHTVFLCKYIYALLTLAKKFCSELDTNAFVLPKNDSLIYYFGFLSDI